MANSHPADTLERTLPDLLRAQLEIVFVGINPSIYSVSQGHYFARRGNRFWPCFSRSALSAGARAGLGLAQLDCTHDHALLDYGFGFTDVVKRATARADEIAPAEFAAGAAALAAKLKRFRPRIACFHGITGFRHVQRVLAPAAPAAVFGAQSWGIGSSLLFVIPNPSGANPRSVPSEQIRWYDRLAHALAVR